MSATKAPPSPSVRPFWLPPGVALDELRAAIEGVIGPAYQKLVLGTRPGAEQSTGVTIVGLLWLEIVELYQLGRDSPDDLPQAEQLQAREKAINRLLRLVGSKMKASDFLLRLAAYRWKTAPPIVPPFAAEYPTADGAEAVKEEGLNFGKS